MDGRYREPENFKWEILGNTVFEDYQMFYEPFAEARTIFPGRGDAERATLTEQALRELYVSGLIFSSAQRAR